MIREGDQWGCGGDLQDHMWDSWGWTMRLWWETYKDHMWEVGPWGCGGGPTKTTCEICEGGPWECGGWPTETTCEIREAGPWGCGGEQTQLHLLQIDELETKEYQHEKLQLSYHEFVRIMNFVDLNAIRWIVLDSEIVKFKMSAKTGYTPNPYSERKLERTSLAQRYVLGALVCYWSNCTDINPRPSYILMSK